MSNSKINISYICAVVHLVLMNLLPFATNETLYTILYLSAYVVPILTLLLVYPAKIVRKHRISFSDILVYFPTMLLTSYCISSFISPAQVSYTLNIDSIITIGIVTPILEELFWRGSFFRILSKFGFVPAALISSFFFALMHQGVGGMTYAFFSGIIFSYLTYTTGSALSAIILHMMNNLTALVLSNYQFEFTIFVTVLLVIGTILKVFIPSRQIHTQKNTGKLNAFTAPYLYLSLLIFIGAKLLEAYFG